uniref:Putative secreted protein n=1 Tax=Ixodes ricinus TaxID=34613 RepID=A0A6B0U916_IXORI
MLFLMFASRVCFLFICLVCRAFSSSCPCLPSCEPRMRTPPAIRSRSWALVRRRLRSWPSMTVCLPPSSW